ncbi:MAG: hypothetical protein H7A06_10620 [Pseudomonadales bacterium]|nr:hypothetical protein [Pseudomonadales bacterium]
MELSKFVQTTIEQIITGVSNSQEFARSKGATVNPARLEYLKDGKNNFHNSPLPQNVEFDVGLTSTSTDESTEGIGVFLGSINLGKKNEVGTEHTAITSVKFTVPIVLPSDEN